MSKPGRQRQRGSWCILTALTLSCGAAFDQGFTLGPSPVPIPNVDLTASTGALCSTAGGCVVTLQGTGFWGSATRVSVDERPATEYHQQTSTRQVFKAPPAEPGRAGFRDLVVSNDVRPPAREQKLSGEEGFYYFTDSLNFLPVTQGLVKMPAAATALVTADFNGDSEQDFAVLSKGRDFVDIYVRKVGGRYAAPFSIPTGKGPVALATADLNGDTAPDLVIVNEGSESMTVLLSKTPATLTFEQREQKLVHTTSPSHQCRRPSDVVLVDLHPDGVPDVVVACRGGGGVPGQFWAFANDKSGNLTIRDADYTHKNEYPAPVLLRAFDFGESAVPDLMLLTEMHRIEWIGSEGGVVFHKGSSNPLAPTGGRFIVTMAIGPVMGTTWKDLLAVEKTQSGASLLVLPNRPNINFILPSMPPLREAYQQLFVIDVNGDGNQDALATTVEGKATRIADLYLGNGDGTFQTRQDLDLGVSYQRAEVADVDKDSYPDLVLLGAEVPGANPGPGESFMVVIPNERGTLRPPTRVTTLSNPERVASADFDGDKELDLAIVSRGSSSQVQIWKGLGRGQFAAIGTPIPLQEPLDLIAVVPRPGPALPDLVVGSVTGTDGNPLGNVTVLHNDGSGRLTIRCTSPGGGRVLKSLAVGHVLGQVQPEVVIATSAEVTLIKPDPDRAGMSCDKPMPDRFAIPGLELAAVAQLDADRNEEIITVQKEGTKHRLSVNKIVGLAWTEHAFNRLDAAPTSLLVTSMNSDARPDLVLLHRGQDGPNQMSASTATVLLQKGMMPGAFDLKPPQPVCEFPVAAWGHDFNGDSRGDLLVACIGAQPKLQPYYGDGRGGLAAASQAVPWIDPMGPVDLVPSGGKPFVVLLDSKTGAQTALENVGP